MAEFVAHYHAERNHQGLGNELIEPLADPLLSVSFAGGGAWVGG
jgi:hypothetical protein